LDENKKVVISTDVNILTFVLLQYDYVTPKLQCDYVTPSQNKVGKEVSQE